MPSCTDCDFCKLKNGLALSCVDGLSLSSNIESPQYYTFDLNISNIINSSVIMDVANLSIGQFLGSINQVYVSDNLYTFACPCPGISSTTGMNDMINYENIIAELPSIPSDIGGIIGCASFGGICAPLVFSNEWWSEWERIYRYSYRYAPSSYSVFVDINFFPNTGFNLYGRTCDIPCEYINTRQIALTVTVNINGVDALGVPVGVAWEGGWYNFTDINTVFDELVLYKMPGVGNPIFGLGNPRIVYPNSPNEGQMIASQEALLATPIPETITVRAL